MIELKGKYNKDCKIFTDDVEKEAIQTIQSLLDQQASENVQVRVMCDVHQGKGTVIGMTLPLTNLVNPNLVGCDIGCGLLTNKLSKDTKLNLEYIDNTIKRNIPMGFNIHETSVFKNIPFNDVQMVADKFVINFNKKFNTNYESPTYNEKWLSKKLDEIDMDSKKFWNSIGTMGGNNHFYELGIQEINNNPWITVHSGSRNFGLKIADYWSNVARKQLDISPKEYQLELDNIIQNTYPKSDIPKRMKELKDKYSLGINKEYLKGENVIGYLFDMIFAQFYAQWNRQTMMDIVLKSLNIKKVEESISTIHNYINMNDFIIRKGAISSYIGQKMIIPFNQKDGILICEGKSNADFNFSAPHGAGRIMSRSEAKQKISLEQVQYSMKGIYTTSVCKETVDESVFAYKKSSMIEELIEPTATILDRIKPILNIKDIGKSVSWKERKEEKKKKYLERKNQRSIKRIEF
jgi:RNA-splicing ligase RtcB